VTAREHALRLAELLEARQAREVVVLDVSSHTIVTDFFVVATAANKAHMAALAETVEQGDPALHHREGRDDAAWVLFDCGDVVVHLFSEEGRRFYALERLWGDVPRVLWSGS
jgi:ribosome-associated protein